MWLVVTSLEGYEKNFNRILEDLRNHVRNLRSDSRQLQRMVEPPREEPKPVERQGRPLVLRFKQWGDFITQAHQAHSISFLHDEAEKKMKIHALKNNKIMIFNCELPGQTLLLRAWISNQLETPENRIFEGTLSQA